METPKQENEERMISDESQAENITILEHIKPPEEVKVERQAEIEENNGKIEYKQQNINFIQSGLDKVRSELGIPTPTEIPPSIASELESIGLIKEKKQFS